MTVTENVTATGAGTDVTLTAIDAAAAGQNLLLNGGVTISSAAASVTLNAGDNATITGNVTSGTSPRSTSTSAMRNRAVRPRRRRRRHAHDHRRHHDAEHSGGGAFLNGGNDYDTFTFNPQTTTEFRVDGDLPLGGVVGDILVMNVTGTTNPNLTVPGTRPCSTANLHRPGLRPRGPSTRTHREVLFTSIEDAPDHGHLIT